jgi:glutathione S-transferase
MLTLVIGNKNYSSWSLRPWLLLRAFNIPFVEEQVWFDTDKFARVIGGRLRSPNARVPVLWQGEQAVWDSLAICEFLAEQTPAMWPANAVARAHARSACAEMHSGFSALRNRMPMNVRRSYPVALEPAVAQDVARITALWAEARSRFRTAGPYLYGAFSVADAYFAPVVFRFNTYAVQLPDALQTYLKTMLAHPALQDWAAAAKAETAVVDHEEPEHIYEAKHV